MFLRIACGFILLCLTHLSLADDIRPAYLEIRENSTDVYSVLWKLPARGDRKLNLQVELPVNCIDTTKANTQLINAAYIQRWVTNCEGGLTGRSIKITGLESTSTDMILQIGFINGISHSAQLGPTNSSYLIPEESSDWQVAYTYTLFGIEHILIGADHLLFVFALLLIVSSVRKLIATITAFTLAHSITLGAATLGLVHVPQQPVEAVIALSIVFLAVEIMHGRQGRAGYAARWPWLVAFIFGLLHGFGFAGALSEIGLPQQAIPLALIFFNVGVELGQLLFVSVIILFTWLLHQFIQHKNVSRAETVVVYAIGGLASFWLIERISAF